MTDRCVGFQVSKDKVVIVDAEVPKDGPIVIQMDDTWNLQKGEREDAYHVLYQQISNYLRAHDVKRVLLKGSAASAKGMGQAHLESAEVRGVVIAAARSVCSARAIKKSTASKTFGERNVDEYVKDNSFWDENVEGADLRIGSREAAFMLIAFGRAE